MVPHMKQRFPRFHGFVAARFSAKEVFGLHLTIGLVLLLSAAWVFGQIADDVVRQARITVLDVQLAQYFHTFAGSGWTRFMLVITHTHATIPLLGLAALLGPWLGGDSRVAAGNFSDSCSAWAAFWARRSSWFRPRCGRRSRSSSRKTKWAPPSG